MTFQKFKAIIRARGGIWASDDVHFSRSQQGYTAAYRPNYPEKSAEDHTVWCCWINGIWIEGDAQGNDVPIKF